jgi:sarcosine oxidase delta subunit
MQLIECPWCGPREEVEFHYGGQAQAVRNTATYRFAAVYGPDEPRPEGT